MSAIICLQALAAVLSAPAFGLRNAFCGMSFLILCLLLLLFVSDLLIIYSAMVAFVSLRSVFCMFLFITHRGSR